MLHSIRLLCTVMVPPLILLEGWILQDSFQLAMHRPLEACTFVTPELCAGRSQCWAAGTAGAGIRWKFSCFPHCCQLRGAQGWLSTGLWASVPHGQGCSPQRCLCSGTQLRLLHLSQLLEDYYYYYGLFSYAGSGSDCSVLSDISPQVFPSQQWNKTMVAAPFHFPSGWPPQRGHPAHQLREPVWLPGGGSTTYVLLLPAPGWHCQGLLSVQIPSWCHAGLCRHWARGTTGLQQLRSGTGTAPGSG